MIQQNLPFFIPLVSATKCKVLQGASYDVVGGIRKVLNTVLSLFSGYQLKSQDFDVDMLLVNES